MVPSLRHPPLVAGATDIVGIISDALAEASHVSTSDPLVFVGLRLLQHSERAIVLPPTTPSTRAAAPVSASSPSHEAVSAQLRVAEEELHALREELRRVEVAEATMAARAMQVILNSPTSLEQFVFTEASTVIQAGFHGFVCRRWMRDACATMEEDRSEAASAIQACYHGMVCRRWLREDNRHSKGG